jgi:hypothetical protein
MLGVSKKLVKYVVHWCKIKEIKNSSHMLPKLQLTNFWSQEILGVNRDFRALLKLRCVIISYISTPIWGC